jgi:acyl carrier protein
MDTIAEAVRKVIADIAGVDSNELQADNRLVEDLSLDSIELVNVAMDLEESLDIEIPDSEINAAMTVGQVVDAVKKFRCI